MNPNPELKCELKYIVYTGRSKQVRIFIWILWVIDNFLERLNGSEEARQFVLACKDRGHFWPFYATYVAQPIANILGQSELEFVSWSKS